MLCNFHTKTWKFQDFPTTQILREINLGHFDAPKTAILTIWAPLKFEFLGSFNIFKCEIFPKIKIQSFQNCILAVLDLLKSAKIDFAQNLSGIKIAKFPHCETIAQWVGNIRILLSLRFYVKTI